MTETIEPNTSAVKNQIGVIGLAPMGKNLAKNLASRDFSTSVYNRSHQKTVELESEKNPNIKGFESLCEFIESLELPRKIILMVKSGDAVDKIISELEPLLNDGDILIDCGNSYWKDTDRKSVV